MLDCVSIRKHRLPGTMLRSLNERAVGAIAAAATDQTSAAGGVEVSCWTSNPVAGQLIDARLVPSEQVAVGLESKVQVRLTSAAWTLDTKPRARIPMRQKSKR